MRTLLALLLFALFDWCCMNRIAAPVARIKSLTNKYGLTVNYSYDSLGRIRLKSSGPKGNQTIYVYSRTFILRQTVDSTGDVFKSDTFFMNAKGLADSIVGKHCVPGLHITGVMRKKLFYDGEGRMTQLIDLVRPSDSLYTNDTLYYFYDKGNLSHIFRRDAMLVFDSELPTRMEGYSERTTCMNYSSDKNFCLTDDNGETFLGKPSPNLLKSSYTLNEKNDTIDQQRNQYKLDSKGRIENETITRIYYYGKEKRIDTDSYSYTYY